MLAVSRSGIRETRIVQLGVVVDVVAPTSLLVSSTLGRQSTEGILLALSAHFGHGVQNPILRRRHLDFVHAVKAC